jgi:CDP-2,3-bis-(O-geranylgeranyl)-sn-glycerol synthase
MYEELAIIGLSLWLGLPAWIANATPVIFGGGSPIDRGRMFRDGKRVLGDGKTIRGFVAGVLWGTLTGAVLSLAAPFVRVEMLVYGVNVSADMDVILGLDLVASLLLSIGALMGDMVGSFLKRRISLRSGQPSLVMDQLGFIIMALVFAAPILTPSWVYPGILILVTLFIHWISNALGYLLGLKDNPW